MARSNPFGFTSFYTHRYFSVDGTLELLVANPHNDEFGSVSVLGYVVLRDDDTKHGFIPGFRHDDLAFLGRGGFLVPLA